MPAKSLKHKFLSAVADGTDTTLVRPSNWNDDHDLWLGNRTVLSGPDTITNADHLSLIQYSSGTAVAVTLPQAGASGQFLAGWAAWVRNRGAGLVTITPTTSTINESASLAIPQNNYAQIISDGTNYAAIIIPGAATAAPLDDTVAAAVGTATKWAREDHSHRRDPTKLSLDGTTPMTGRLSLPSALSPRVDKGTISSGTVTFDVSAAARQRLQVGGALTVAYSNWPATGNYGEIMIQLVNGGAAAVTWPTTTWMVGDGTSSTTFSAMGVTLQSIGTNWITVWSLDGGTTLYGRAM